MFHVEQSSGSSGFMGFFEGGFGCAGWNTSKQGKTFPNKKKHHQTRKPPFKQEKYLPKQEKHLSSKGNAFQARDIFRSNVKVYKW